ncbi:hypothetical protein EVAR_66677_1 [Eumeta japonica]|uniref:LIM zinc-binding domain-containing protein n=1 Tax=Eumeta variegata TaxID=151549 RepID=A0A4C1ZG47_EUMVA|nr:hypothetical protein EVAR_66677_1 [Eumeta japonica]
MVMRAKDMVYHLSCFNCVACGALLSKGDVFGMRDGLVYCRPHYDGVCFDENCEDDLNSVYRCQELHGEVESPSQYYNGGPVQKGRPRKRKVNQASSEDMQVQTMRMANTALGKTRELSSSPRARPPRSALSPARRRCQFIPGPSAAANERKMHRLTRGRPAPRDRGAVRARGRWLRGRLGRPAGPAGIILLVRSRNAGSRSRESGPLGATLDPINRGALNGPRSRRMICHPSAPLTVCLPAWSL